MRKLSLYIFCLSFIFAKANLEAKDSTPIPDVHPAPIGIYFGGCFGWGFSCVEIKQSGTILYSDASGGPQAVEASGSSSNSHYWFGSLQMGYEFLKKQRPAWIPSPAVEIEGYYFANLQKAYLPTSSGLIFTSAFPTRTGVLLANGSAVFSSDFMALHITGGLGAGKASIHGASSEQTNPSNPGVNFFNTDQNDSNWNLAIQAKVGLSYSFTSVESFIPRLLFEYRFLYLSPTTFTFGPSEYPNQPSTTKWNVRFGERYSHLLSAGLTFLF